MWLFWRNVQTLKIGMCLPDVFNGQAQSNEVREPKRCNKKGALAYEILPDILSPGKNLGFYAQPA